MRLLMRCRRTKGAKDAKKLTVELHLSSHVRVHCLQLGGADLTSSAGKMTMAVITAVAEFERDLLIERTQAGLKRAKDKGKVMGRPSALTAEQQEDARQRLARGDTVSELARIFKTSRTTIQRVRDRA